MGHHKKTLTTILLLAILVISLYSGGAAVLLWCGLSFHYLHWSTFIIVWLEFYDVRYFNVLIFVSGLGFTLPSLIAWIIFLIFKAFGEWF